MLPWTRSECGRTALTTLCSWSVFPRASRAAPGTGRAARGWVSALGVALRMLVGIATSLALRVPWVCATQERLWPIRRGEAACDWQGLLLEVLSALLCGLTDLIMRVDSSTKTPWRAPTRPSSCTMTACPSPSRMSRS